MSKPLTIEVKNGAHDWVFFITKRGRHPTHGAGIQVSKAQKVVDGHDVTWRYDAQMLQLTFRFKDRDAPDVVLYHFDWKKYQGDARIKFVSQGNFEERAMWTIDHVEKHKHRKPKRKEPEFFVPF